MKKSQVNYRQIYDDILAKKFPEKIPDFQPLLKKRKLSELDIISLNEKIFGNSRETARINQKHRSYGNSTIFEILDYQKKYNLNNSQTANHFKISRNTIAKWKKDFIL